MSDLSAAIYNTGQYHVRRRPVGLSRFYARSANKGHSRRTAPKRASKPVSTPAKVAYGSRLMQGRVLNPPLRPASMPNDPRPRRRSLRLPGYDYSQAGAYFITACTQNRVVLSVT
jgi:hypothetical protein